MAEDIDKQLEAIRARLKKLEVAHPAVVVSGGDPEVFDLPLRLNAVERKLVALIELLKAPFPEIDQKIDAACKEKANTEDHALGIALDQEFLDETLEDNESGPSVRRQR